MGEQYHPEAPGGCLKCAQGLCGCQGRDQIRSSVEAGTDQYARNRRDYSKPPMPAPVRELVEVMRSAYLLKFPELCGTREETRILNAIAAVRAHYGEKP